MLVYKTQMSKESSGKSESEGTRAAELVEYDEITLPINNTAKVSTSLPANSIHLTKNSAYSGYNPIAIPAAIV